MDDPLYSVLVGTAGLSVLALVALALTLTRAPDRANRAARRRVVRLGALALVLQSAHFAEELLTGFYERFPELLGLRPWPVAFFVAFNLFWIAVWALSLIGVRRPFRIAFFPLWFLGLGAALNGLAHPLFAVAVGGYFPGLWTSPFVGVAGVVLLRGLAAFTLRRPQTADRRLPLRK